MPAEPIAVVWAAEDPKEGLTLDELALFVQQAMHLDLPGNTVIRVRIGWKQQVQKISTRRL